MACFLFSRRQRKKKEKTPYLAPPRRQRQELFRARRFDPEPTRERRGHGQRERDLPGLAEGAPRVRCGGGRLKRSFFFLRERSKVSLSLSLEQSSHTPSFRPLFFPRSSFLSISNSSTWKSSELLCPPEPERSSNGNKSLARNASPIALLAAASARASPLGSTLVASRSPTSLRSSVGPRRRSRQSSRELEDGTGGSGVAAGGGCDGDEVGRIASVVGDAAAAAADAFPPPPPLGLGPLERKPFCIGDRESPGSIDAPRKREAPERKN